MKNTVTATLNFSAWHHNLSCVRSLAPNSRVVAVIKANAYGHGLLRAARALNSTDIFAVARSDEALILLENGISKSILVLEGFLYEEELEIFSNYGIQSVLHSNYQLILLEKTNLKKPIKVWIKIDSGMHRLGFSPYDFNNVLDRVVKCNNVSGICLISHLANSDNLSDPYNLHQIKIFERITNGLNIERSIASSSAIIGFPKIHFDYVRPGIMLYGCSPLVRTNGSFYGLIPVMTLESKLISINNYLAGDSIGYGGIWTCKRNSRIGVVGIGYGDGYPRNAPYGTPVLIKGKRVPLVGRVSMDMITVDLSEFPDINLGDSVVLWGKELPVEEIASIVNTISYDLLCRITTRVCIVEKD